MRGKKKREFWHSLCVRFFYVNFSTKKNDSSAGMKSSAATGVMVARAGRHLTPFRVDLRDAVTGAFAGVGRQRLAITLFTGRAFAHVQQTRSVEERKKIFLFKISYLSNLKDEKCKTYLKYRTGLT